MIDKLLLTVETLSNALIPALEAKSYTINELKVLFRKKSRNSIYALKKQGLKFETLGGHPVVKCAEVERFINSENKFKEKYSHILNSKL